MRSNISQLLYILYATKTISKSYTPTTIKFLWSPPLNMYKSSLQLCGLGQVKSQPKPNPNMKYINPNITQPNFQTNELNPNWNLWNSGQAQVLFIYGRLIKLGWVRLGRDKIKILIELQNYLTTLHELLLKKWKKYFKST